MSSPETKDTELEPGPPIQDPLVPPEPEEKADTEPEPASEKAEAVAAKSEPPAAPIADPHARSVARVEAERIAVETLAARARWLSIAGLVAAGIAALVAIVSLTGRVDPSVLISVLPLGIVNAVLGVQARRAAAALDDLKKGLDDRDAILSSVQELGRVFVVQLLATIFFVLLLLLALGLALAVKSAGG